MVRNLEAQARAIWPQERPLIERYELPTHARVLDAGCGTGEASSRIAELLPQAHVLGVDIIDAHLALARRRHASLASRLTFEHQDVYALASPDTAFDLVICRHVLHSIPDPRRVLAKLVRVTKPGGRLHLIPEDYGMLHFQSAEPDPRAFWNDAPAEFGGSTKTDNYVGRNAYTLLADLRLEDVSIDYVVVDTLRVPREVFAGIIGAWRDGYVNAIAARTRFSREVVRGTFDRMVENILDPQRYAVWFVPVVAAPVPAGVSARSAPA